MDQRDSGAGPGKDSSSAMESPRNNSLYNLKELEFRYNNRNSDIFDPVAIYLCDLVPDRD